LFREGERVGAGQDPDAEPARFAEMTGFGPEYRPATLIAQEEVAGVGAAQYRAEQAPSCEEPFPGSPRDDADRAPIASLAKHVVDRGAIGHAARGAQHEYLEILAGRHLAPSDQYQRALAPSRAERDAVGAAFEQPAAPDRRRPAREGPELSERVVGRALGQRQHTVEGRPQP